MTKRGISHDPQEESPRFSRALLAAEYLTFVTIGGTGGVGAVYADENVWLSQKMVAQLYDVPCKEKKP